MGKEGIDRKLTSEKSCGRRSVPVLVIGSSNTLRSFAWTPPTHTHTKSCKRGAVGKIKKDNHFTLHHTKQIDNTMGGGGWYYVPKVSSHSKWTNTI